MTTRECREAGTHFPAQVRAEVAVRLDDVATLLVKLASV